MIKAAWRRLARTHHPDLTGDDPDGLPDRDPADGRDQRCLRSADPRRRPPRQALGRQPRPRHRNAGRARRRAEPGRGGPPRPKPTRPVTARVDTTHTVRPRNQPIRTARARRRSRSCAASRRSATYVPREPPRASTPTGPMARSVARDFRQPAAPALADALDMELEFGKFHGHTLGQVAGFEPSYIDWLATTITRDRDLRGRGPGRPRRSRSARRPAGGRGRPRRPGRRGDRRPPTVSPADRLAATRPAGRGDRPPEDPESDQMRDDARER